MGLAGQVVGWSYGLHFLVVWTSLVSGRAKLDLKQAGRGQRFGSSCADLAKCFYRKACFALDLSEARRHALCANN